MACALEVVLLQRPFPGAPGWAGARGVLGAQALRYWAIATLGWRWNTRIVVVPGAAPVTAGPYRCVRHPNYVAVIAEMIALPLVHGAWLTALVVLGRQRPHSCGYASAPRSGRWASRGSTPLPVGRGSSPEATVATEIEVLETIRTIARTELEMERSIVPEDDLLRDLALDSLGLTVLAVGLENRFRVKLSEEDAAGVQTVGDLARHVSARTQVTG